MLCSVGIHCAKLKNKSSKSGADTSESSKKSAIIAIQIIDPEEEESGNKHSKRTIGSSLGYGYQNNNIYEAKVSPPRYEVYRYSQHDIPAYEPTQYKNNYDAKSSGFHGKSSYSPNNQRSGESL